MDWVEGENARLRVQLEAFNGEEMRTLAGDGSLDVRFADVRFPEFARLF